MSNEQTKEWLIWSIEHGAWWAPNSLGYTKSRKNAGLYSWDDALAIVRGANTGLNDQTPPHEAMIHGGKQP
jgi:hypothetical protein